MNNLRLDCDNDGGATTAAAAATTTTMASTSTTATMTMKMIIMMILRMTTTIKQAFKSCNHLLPPYLSTLKSSSSLLYKRDLKHDMRRVA